jgi:small subunit ribosomal protein S8
MLSDPIADMLTRIRNANSALLPEVKIPHSKMKESIARILKKQGYIVDFNVEGDKMRTVKVTLKYADREGVIKGLKRISKPGLRLFVKSTEIPRVLGGLGISIVSTSQGLLAGHEARKNGIGGELVCYVW